MYRFFFYPVLLIFLFGGCKSIENAEPWWKQTVFYQVYMPSFQDSDGDGFSDFDGLTSRLDYLQQIGVKGIWLTPFMTSPRVDNGYDIADYYQVDPTYGTLANFKLFLHEAHQRDIRVIMDMVVNHTSTDCYWFQQSRLSKDNPFRDYYVWRDEPNNWESFFGGSAWAFDSITAQYYYHKFDVRMADLNWTNPRVVEEMQNVLRFWLDLGIDGFRLDVINFLLTDGIGDDNPMENGKQNHIHDIDQPGVKDAMRILKSTINAYPDKFVVGEIGSDNLQILKQYQGSDLMDVVFNFNLGSIPTFSLERIFAELHQMEEELVGLPTLFFGSHDMPRLMSRLADDNIERAEALAALILTARGVPFIYYGEEIGMQNIVARSLDDIVDIQGRTQYMLALEASNSPEEALEASHYHNRDRSRSPMQWDGTAHAGFTSGEPWIRVHENFREVNVENALIDDESILHTYKRLIQLRNTENVLQTGRYKSLELKNDALFFTRSLDQELITVVINFGDGLVHELPANAEILMGKAKLATNGFLIYKHWE